MNFWTVVSVAGLLIAGSLWFAQSGATARAEDSTRLADEVAWEKRYEKPPAKEIRAQLTDIQWRVTQEDGTERPFSNPYWNNEEPGIYVDVVTGEPLFSSTHKFKSGTGWPSFYRPLVADHVVEKVDRSHFMVRTEVRSRDGDSHLGHVFRDGPAPTGLRYCINSAALRFIPAAKLETEGYGAFTSLFEAQAGDVRSTDGS